MLLKLSEPKFLTDSIGIISDLVTEVKAKINNKGFEIIAVDPANVSLVILRLDSSLFSEFKVEREEELGLNLDSFKQILKRVPSGSSLILEKQENMLKISIQDKIKRDFLLSLLNIEQEEKSVPNLIFKSKIEMPSNIFSEAITDASVVADSCSFITKKPNLFIIEAKGTLNQMRSEFSSDEARLEIQDCKARYSLEYLMKFIKASKLSEKVKIQFSDDYPSRFDFGSEKIMLSFILAPRVEED